jgi:hypothetical protein
MIIEIKTKVNLSNNIIEEIRELIEDNIGIEIIEINEKVKVLENEM